jgi:putative two-component system response regulator
MVGKPEILKGKIPLSARIMNICDIYDALRSKRPYKPALDHAKATGIIIKGDGRTDRVRKGVVKITQMLF